MECFSQAVSIVESEGDRAVYEAATEMLNKDLQQDTHFVSVGGIGGFASTSLLYKKLKIPTLRHSPSKARKFSRMAGTSK